MLIMEQDSGYHGGILRGVIDYAKTHGRWAFHLHSPAYADPLMVVQGQRPDAIVINIFEPRWAAALQEWGIPTVNVGCRNDAVHLPRVGVDDVAAGRLAARYLAERGFRHFAFYGDSHMGYSRERLAGFESELVRHGFRCMVFEAAAAIHRLPQARERRWLAALPKPIAIFAASDPYGLAIADACAQVGLGVPDPVAILSMDNNELLCHLAHRPLSSIVNPAARIGYEAAAMLDRLISNRHARAASPPPTILIQPPGIITRQSTDVLAVNDAVVAEALRLIRDGANRPLGVKELLRQIPVSRRALERHFAQAIGRTLMAEIRRAHVELAKDLLTQTDLCTEQIAERCGLRHAANLSMLFRKTVGLTPGAYRRAWRASEVVRPTIEERSTIPQQASVCPG